MTDRDSMESLSVRKLHMMYIEVHIPIVGDTREDEIDWTVDLEIIDKSTRIRSTLDLASYRLSCVLPGETVGIIRDKDPVTGDELRDSYSITVRKRLKDRHGGSVEYEITLGGSGSAGGTRYWVLASSPIGSSIPLGDYVRIAVQVVNAAAREGML